MSDDPNSGQATEREACTPLSDNELDYMLRSYGNRTMTRCALLELIDQRRYRATLQKENAELRGQIELLTKVDSDEQRLKDMLEIIEEQRHDPDAASFTLGGFSNAGLDQVEAFVTSFWRHSDAVSHGHEARGAEAPAAEGSDGAREITLTELFGLVDRLSTATEKLAERVHANAGNMAAAHKRIDDAFRQLGQLQPSTDIARIDEVLEHYAEALQHHASLIAGLGRQAVDEAAKPEFPDPVPAEELVLERGSIVRIHAGTKAGTSVLAEDRAWEVVGVRSAVGEPSVVQLGYLPWDADRQIGRPIYWIRADDIVGLAE